VAAGGDVGVGIECAKGGCAASVGDIRGAACAADVVGAVVDPEADEDTDCDRYLKMLVSSNGLKI
jgi:hypothetical protein